MKLDKWKKTRLIKFHSQGLLKNQHTFIRLYFLMSLIPTRKFRGQCIKIDHGGKTGLRPLILFHQARDIPFDLVEIQNPTALAQLAVCHNNSRSDIYSKTRQMRFQRHIGE